MSVKQVTTMSTIGYGDISPHTAPERWLGMLLMSAGCAFFAWITGRITQLLTKKSACEERFLDLMEDLDTFMDARNFSDELRAKVVDFYKVKYPSKRVFDQQLIIDGIESPSIKRDILQHVYQDVVTHNALFGRFDEATRKEISLRLCAGYRMPGMWLTKAGTVPEALYVVRFGTMKLHAEGLPTRHCASGEMFGAMALLGLSPNGKRLYNSTAISIVEFCSLSSDAFYELLACLPHLRETILKVSKIHIACLRAAGIRAQTADVLFAQAESRVFAARSSSAREAGADEDDNANAEASQLLSERKFAKQDAEGEYLDRLSSIRWHNIQAQIDLQDQVAQYRREQRSIDIPQVEALEAATGCKMLVTRLHFRIHSLRLKTKAGAEAEAVDNRPNILGADLPLQQGAAPPGQAGAAISKQPKQTDLGLHCNGPADDDIQGASLDPQQKLHSSAAHPSDSSGTLRRRPTLSPSIDPLSPWKQCKASTLHQVQRYIMMQSLTAAALPSGVQCSFAVGRAVYRDTKPDR